MANQESNKKRKKWLLPALIAAVAVIAVGGFFAYRSLQTSEAVTTSNNFFYKQNPLNADAQLHLIDAKTLTERKLPSALNYIDGKQTRVSYFAGGRVLIDTAKDFNEIRQASDSVHLLDANYRVVAQFSKFNFPNPNWYGGPIKGGNQIYSFASDGQVETNTEDFVLGADKTKLLDKGYQFLNDKYYYSKETGICEADSGKRVVKPNATTIIGAGENYFLAIKGNKAQLYSYQQPEKTVLSVSFSDGDFDFFGDELLYTTARSTVFDKKQGLYVQSGGDKVMVNIKTKQQQKLAADPTYAPLGNTGFVAIEGKKATVYDTDGNVKKSGTIKLLK